MESLNSKKIIDMIVLNYFKENYVLVSILVLAAFLRFYHINFQSLWLDEVLTFKETNPKMLWSEFKDCVLLREGMSYFYFTIIRILNDVFGYSSYTMRMFSAVTGICSVYAIYSMGKTIFNKNVGLITAALLCVNWFGISYSQEARSYALYLLFVIISYTRIALFIKNPNYKNAILYGIITGLVINSHTVGLITIFSQYVLLIFIFLIEDKEKKANFFTQGIIILFTTVLTAYPTYKTLLKAKDYKSGWLTLPGPDGITSIFHQLLGNTELLGFVFSSIIIFYLFKLFNQKEFKLTVNEITNNKLLFSSLLLFSGFFLPILLPIIKSYTSEPMIISRYFIALLPALLIAIAIGIELIKIKILKGLLILVIISFSLVDVILIKDYYNTISKSQFSQVANLIIKKNENRDKIYSPFGFVFSALFDNTADYDHVVEMTLEDYLNGIRNNTIGKESFWIMDGNARPFTTSVDNQKYLEENYIFDFDLNTNYDAWARHYRLKNSSSQEKKIDGEGNLFLKDFTPLNLDLDGNLAIFNNGIVKSKEIELPKGYYTLIINGNSYPETPIKGQNAHLKIKINDTQIDSYFLSEKQAKSSHQIKFENTAERITLSIEFDNDLSEGSLDRNVILQSISIKAN